MNVKDLIEDTAYDRPVEKLYELEGYRQKVEFLAKGVQA